MTDSFGVRSPAEPATGAPVLCRQPIKAHQLRSSGPPVLHLRPPREIAGQQQRNRLDLLRSLNQRHRQQPPR